MRKCIRCNAEMAENLDIMVQSVGYGIVISENTNFFANRIGKPKIAICPQCGEISLYMEVKDIATKK